MCVLLASGFRLAASRFRLPASGFRLPASGFWLLASGFWLLASGFWLLASGFWLLASPLTDPFSVQQHIQGVLHGTGGSDFSGVDKENLIGIRDGVQAMRDDDLRARLRQPIEYLLELLLGH